MKYWRKTLPRAKFLKLQSYQVNNPKHPAVKMTEWFQAKKIKVLKWPNLKRIENLWKEIKVHQKNSPKLKAIYQQEC